MLLCTALISIFLICCTATRRTPANSQNKPQEFLERIVSIERQGLSPDVFTDSISDAVCEYLIKKDISLLEESIDKAKTLEEMNLIETDTTSVTWSGYRVGMMIRSIMAFRTNGERLPQSIIESLDKKSRLKCSNRYTYYLEVQKKQDVKVQRLVAQKLNAD